MKASVGISHDRCEINETQEWISHCNGSFSSVCTMQNKMSIDSILWTSISQPASQTQPIAGYLFACDSGSEYYLGKSHDRCEINETQVWISHCNGSFSSVCSMQNKMSIESILWTSISQPASQTQPIAGYLFACDSGSEYYLGKSHDRCEITETQKWITHSNGSFRRVYSMQNKMSIYSILWTSISQVRRGHDV